MSSRREIRALRQRLVDLENRSTKTAARNTAVARVPKPGSRRARREKRSRAGGVTMIGRPNSSAFIRSEAPVAYSYCGQTPVYQRIRGNVRHPEHGVGILVQGRQLLTDVTTTATDSQLFAGTGTATVTGINEIGVSPDLFNGRLALIARTYSRYKFTRITFHYVPRVATSDVGLFALGYIQDSAYKSFVTPTFATTEGMDPSMTVSFRKEGTLEVRYSGPKTWFTEYTASTSADERQTAQGGLMGYPDATSIGALQHGWIWVDYEIEFYQPSVDFGFTLDVKTEEEQAAAKLAVMRIRDSKRQTAQDELEDQEIVMIEGQPFVRAKAA
jgi:hypothetical protein